MEERRRLALLMADTWLEMIFRHGVFHGDPHPANLFALPDGRLGLVDFGQIGSLTDADMQRLTRLLLDCVNENVDALPRRLYELGVRFNKDQEEEFRIELREIFYRYHGASLGQIDPLQVVREAFTLIYKMQVRLPARFALLDKTLATLGSVGAELYPDFNVFEVAEPYAAELVARRYSPQALLNRGKEQMGDYTGLLMELPFQIHDTLEQLRDGEVEVAFHHKGLDDLIGRTDVMFNRLVVAIVMSGTVIGSSLIGLSAKSGPHLLGINVLALFGFTLATGDGPAAGVLDRPQRPAVARHQVVGGEPSSDAIGASDHNCSSTYLLEGSSLVSVVPGIRIVHGHAVLLDDRAQVSQPEDTLVVRTRFVGQPELWAERHRGEAVRIGEGRRRVWQGRSAARAPRAYQPPGPDTTATCRESR